MRPWTAAVAIYLVVVLAAGLIVNWLVHAREPAPSRRRLERWDVAALALVAVSLVVRWLLMLDHPITSDEASNLEPGFWSGWYLIHESRAHPPLFRFVIHLLALLPDRPWIMRAPSALSGAISVGLVYVLARRRTSGALALVLAALASLHGLHIQLSIVQKNWTTWLLLLLVMHDAFDRAVQGRSRAWFWYALATALACLTHYLTPVYVLGHGVFVILRHRARLRPFLVALAPAILALAPFSVPVVMGGVGGASSYPVTPATFLQAMKMLLIEEGGLGLVGMLAAAWAGSREGDRALPYVMLAGLLAVLAFGMRAVPMQRYFLPLFALGLIWIAGRLGPDPAAWRSWQRIVAAAGALVIALTGAVRLWQDVTREDPRGVAQAYEQADPDAAAGAGPGRAVMVFPGSMVLVLGYEWTGRRDYWNQQCPGVEGRITVVNGSTLLLDVDPSIGPEVLRRANLVLGGFDYIAHDARHDPLPAEVASWLESSCRPIARAKAASGRGGTVYRCGLRPGHPPDSCDSLAEVLE